MDEKGQLMKDLDVAHNAIQHLNITPTKDNMTNMMFVLQTLENAYKFIGSLPDEKDDEDA